MDLAVLPFPRLFDEVTELRILCTLQLKVLRDRSDTAGQVRAKDFTVTEQPMRVIVGD